MAQEHEPGVWVVMAVGPTVIHRALAMQQGRDLPPLRTAVARCGPVTAWSVHMGRRQLLPLLL